MYYFRALTFKNLCQASANLWHAARGFHTWICVAMTVVISLSACSKVDAPISNQRLTDAIYLMSMYLNNSSASFVARCP